MNRISGALCLLLASCAVAPNDDLGRSSAPLIIIPIVEGYRWDRTYQVFGPGGIHPGVWAPPVLVSGATNKMDILTPVDSGEGLGHRFWDGTSTYSIERFVPRPGAISFAQGVSPAATHNGADIDLWFVTPSRELHHARRTTSGWVAYGGYFDELTTTHVTAVAATRMLLSTTSDPLRPYTTINTFRTSLFILRDTGVLEEWSRVNEGAWSTRSLMAGVTSAPASTSWGVGRLDLVFRTGASTLQHLAFVNAGGCASTNTCWSTLAPMTINDMASSPMLAARGPNKLNLFVSTKFGLYETTGDGTTFKPLTNLLAQCTTSGSAFLAASTGLTTFAIGAVGTAPDQLNIYAVDDNFTWHQMYRYGSLIAPTSPTMPTCPSCGIAGVACCSTGPACSSDLLFCSAGTCAPCGGESQSCCGGSTCSAGLACDAGSCRVPCGRLGEACCGATSCNSGLACRGGSCKTPCGGIGQACCSDSSPPCAGTGLCAAEVCRAPADFTAAYTALNVCGNCHNVAAPVAWAPGFFVKDDAAGTMRKLLELGLVRGGDLTSRIWARISKDTMPPAGSGFDPLNAADKTTISNWIMAMPAGPYRF